MSGELKKSDTSAREDCRQVHDASATDPARMSISVVMCSQDVVDGANKPTITRLTARAQMIKERLLAQVATKKHLQASVILVPESLVHQSKTREETMSEDVSKQPAVKPSLSPEKPASGQSFIGAYYDVQDDESRRSSFNQTSSEPTTPAYLTTVISSVTSTPLLTPTPSLRNSSSVKSTTSTKSQSKTALPPDIILAACFDQCQRAQLVIELVHKATVRIACRGQGAELFKITSPIPGFLEPSVASSYAFGPDFSQAVSVLDGWLSGREGKGKTMKQMHLDQLLQDYMPSAWLEIQDVMQIVDLSTATVSRTESQGGGVVGGHYAPDLTQLLLANPLNRASHMLEAVRRAVKRVMLDLTDVTNTSQITRMQRCIAEVTIVAVHQTLFQVLSSLDECSEYVQSVAKNSLARVTPLEMKPKTWIWSLLKEWSPQRLATDLDWALADVK